MGALGGCGGNRGLAGAGLENPGGGAVIGKAGGGDAEPNLAASVAVIRP